MPEKLTPHHDLGAFKRAADRIGVTSKALADAYALGFSRSDITAVLSTIDPHYFYKSMTSHRSNQEWQDVYRVPYAQTVLYVKFRDDILLEFMLLSFKEKLNVWILPALPRGWVKDGKRAKAHSSVLQDGNKNCRNARLVLLSL
ncbi:type II toxin-antitoxin system MqsR family toxin [Methylobacterium oryzihabitans]|uniref:type II toxin-antitoxin system MqsR family toxin n=1 Tax=Methylobacterium oryzihabitans TaxID=2499852 RepID=UPI001FEB12AA|nr:type II toxin-antitoxin system MqsR family toxin [Methylobacterium oryzihabitans]